MIRNSGTVGKISVAAWMITSSIALSQARAGAAQVKADRSIQSNQQKAEELLNDKKYSFEDLLNGKAAAVENARQIFVLTTDTNTKQRIASILLSIGTRDQVYFDYLTREAERALNEAEAMPWPTLYDKDGNTLPEPHAISPAFLKWCDVHKLDPIETFQAAYYETPIVWRHLAAAGDLRAQDLLMKGLHSRNVMISVLAAEGLAKLQVVGAINDIFAVCSRAPLETRYSMAGALLFFPDARAQTAAEALIKDKKILASWQEEARSKGTKALFGY